MSIGGKGGSTGQTAAGQQTLAGFQNAPPANRIAETGQQAPSAIPSAGTGQNVFEQASQGLTGAFGSVYGGLANNAFNSPTPQYDPSFVNQPGSIQGGIQDYMNPYVDEVIGNTMNDMDRMRQMQLTQIQGDASQAGAFGGSRQGLVESELNRNTMQQMGDTSARMRQLAYGQAADLSGQDVANMMTSGFYNQGAANQAGQFNANMQGQSFQDAYMRNLMGADQLGDLSQQAFGFGSDINQQQMQAGLTQQALNQSVLDQGSRLYGGYTESPQQVFNLRLSALGQNPLNRESTTTTQTTPGMFDYLQLGAGLGSAYLGRPT